MKGDGESHPFLSPNDEFADFENWDFGNAFGIPKESKMLQYEYARSALKTWESDWRRSSVSILTSPG